jgi:hypothetical protein
VSARPEKHGRAADPAAGWALYDAEAARRAAQLRIRARPAAGTGADPLPRRPSPRPQPERRPRWPATRSTA